MSCKCKQLTTALFQITIPRALASARNLTYTITFNPTTTVLDKYYPNLTNEETEAREVVRPSLWLVNVEFQPKPV